MAKKKKILIIKLLAFGDIVICYRALKEFCHAYDCSNIEWHWIADLRYQELLNNLTAEFGLQINFHWIDSNHLFQGNLSNKIINTIKLNLIVASINPNKVLIFHRDKRYKLALGLFKPSLLTRTSDPINELQLQLALLKTTLNHLPTKPFTEQNQTNFQKNSIGLLIGGAQNIKVFFQEKRWPNQNQLIEHLLKNSNYRLTFFGAESDINLIQEFQSTNIVNLMGKDLKLVFSHLKNLEYFITIDTGLAHLASLLMSHPAQKIICLFGPTNPDSWAPLSNQSNQVTIIKKDFDCVPCYKDDGNYQPCFQTNEKHHQCMRSITVNDVLCHLNGSK